MTSRDQLERMDGGWVWLTFLRPAWCYSMGLKLILYRNSCTFNAKIAQSKILKLKSPKNSKSVQTLIAFSVTIRWCYNFQVFNTFMYYVFVSILLRFLALISVIQLPHSPVPDPLDHFIRDYKSIHQVIWLQKMSCPHKNQ